MKKSLMPCERRDPSSVTPDEPAGDDEERGMPDLEATPKKASRTTGTPIVPIGQQTRLARETYLFLIANTRKNRRPIQMPRTRFVTEFFHVLSYDPARSLLTARKDNQVTASSHEMRRNCESREFREKARR